MHVTACRGRRRRENVSELLTDVAESHGCVGASIRIHGAPAVGRHDDDASPGGIVGRLHPGGDVAGDELLRDPRGLTIRAHRADEVHRAMAGATSLGCEPGGRVRPLAAKNPMKVDGVVVIEHERCLQGCNVVDHDVPDNDKNCVDHEVSLPDLLCVSPMPEHRRYEPQARHWR